MQTKKYYIIDTNSFLHYQLFTDLPWSDILDSESIVLVITTTVLRELDQKKFSARDFDLKNRAQLVIKKLSDLLTATDTLIQLKKDIDILYLTKEPGIDWEKENLDDSIPDDRIIATILEAVPQFNDVLLISSDLGLKLKAKGKGIQCTSIPDEFLLKTSNDSKQKEIDKLRQQIQNLESKLPILNLKLSSSKGLPAIFKKYTLTPVPPFSKKDIDDRISKLEKELKYSEPAIDKSTIGGILSSFNTISTEEVERYKKEVKEYLIKMSQYFEREYKVNELISRKITIELLLENQGTAPAEDIDIFLHFPDGFKLFSEDISIDLLEKPTPPVPPRSQREILSSLGNFNFPIPNLDRMSAINNVGRIDLNAPSEPKIIKTNSYDVQYELNKIKHGIPVVLDPLFALFDSIEEAKSFKIDYSIFAGNLPRPSEGELNIVIEKNINVNS